MKTSVLTHDRTRARDRRLVGPLVFAAACTLAALQVGAAPAPPPSVTVEFEDIDTSKEAGAQTLYRRIRAAAEGVCGPEIRSLRLARVRERCVHEAIAAAVADINRPQLSALHRKLVSRAG